MTHSTYLFLMLKTLVIKYKKKIPDSSGQSLIEFVLLFAVIMTATILFYQVFREQIADLWIKLVTMIVDDQRQQIKMP